MELLLTTFCFLSYWDIPYSNFNYSYIDVAVDKYGFCTLSIDRLGIGNSSIADPFEYYPGSSRNVGYLQNYREVAK